MGSAGGSWTGTGLGSSSGVSGASSGGSRGSGWCSGRSGFGCVMGQSGLPLDVSTVGLLIKRCATGQLADTVESDCKLLKIAGIPEGTVSHSFTAEANRYTLAFIILVNWRA